jgi:predicted RNase H-like HicB family nuclease
MIRRYLREALSLARFTRTKDGSYVGDVPGLRGVIATGRTKSACRAELENVIEEWILVRVAKGLNVPTLGGARIAVRHT